MCIRACVFGTRQCCSISRANQDKDPVRALTGSGMSAVSVRPDRWKSWGSAPAQKITFAEMRGRREWVHEGLFCYVNRHDRWYGPKPRR